MSTLPPSPETAYLNAPHVQQETEEILRLRRSGRISDRDWLLRHAALTDQQTLNADPSDGKVQTPVQVTIAKLVTYDAANGTTSGPRAVDDPTWAADPRGYVRQEYAIWAERNVRP
ncbi:hypothetical protein OHA84_37690 (plasmid) [Streptomyces sp. NBC_00513]|uniref:hypothetical protein n=1 Tax=unclassified Streptomyces TaxID=2593676 RepID=UPI00225378F5|nr:hypothetical protein [Streptomyces sp. NBC_00424]MCX5078815.1 hypothetical protein [Streptomyces sp. NBC_00424]WUD46265.1 hypothetical protein OHA84_37690 [Streptomyces sp. NBC_00513]